MTIPVFNTPSRGRRMALQALLGAASFWAAPASWAQSNTDNSANDGRLVIVLLRGAYDGLSALVPYADPHYYALRPNIAIAPPDGSDQTAQPLDGTFGLHPALSALLTLWKQGV
jgi:uncharacterized protein (DUF1501 family)